MLQFLVMSKLGLYVQVPFCQTKCTYCNFHTGVVATDRFTPYVEAVGREIVAHRDILRAAGVGWPSSFDWQTLREVAHPGEIVDSVYIGGGTPSLLEAALVTELLRTIAESFACEWEEVTLEADPETIETSKAGQWVAAGISRISLGSQSFVDE